MKKSFKISIIAVFASLIFISSTTSSSAVKKQSVCFESCEFAWRVLYTKCHGHEETFYALWECLRQADEIRQECERDCYNA